ncbi:MAG TPA: hypothetical protein VMU15_18815 [Anaeromyxobacter sp.]|nr:hypothetical protein [Anaeromyxobacter sp.]
MHPILCLATALALGQAEPAEPPADAAPPAAEEQQAAPPAAPAEAPAAPPVERPHPRPRPAPSASAQAPGEAAPAPTSAPAPGQRPGEAEKAQVARAALAFLDALLQGDARKLAAAGADRFSFDGDVRSGRDQVERAWKELLASRAPADRGVLLDLELLPAADAVARLGPPPPRVAALATARGGWVALANVSRRPVLLFLAREGQRWAVAGME